MILKLFEENKQVLQREFGVKKIGVFGSYARGEGTKHSDIDVIVVFEEGQKTFDNYMGLAFFLERLFGKKVDLLTPEGISPYILPYIEKEIVYEEL
ncbi:MAG: nucleotidyltransferase family protein [Candidatus Thorarchaeota archaeon]|nr:nucleotidyltransferase family protein [Candidatus Thorarchaeota archaeon]